MLELELPHATSSSFGSTHGAGGLGGQPAVLAGRLVAGLPGAVHLVAQAPHPDVVRLLGAVGDAQVGQRGARRVVGVLEQVEGLGDAAGAEVDGHHGLHARLAAPADELVDADLVRLGAVPGQVEPARAPVDRADAVLPSVAGDEVAAGVADGGHAQLPGQVEHVAAEAVLVGRGVAGLVDAGVDAAPEVLHERADGAPAHRGDLEGGIQGEFGLMHGGGSLFLGRYVVPIVSVITEPGQEGEGRRNRLRAGP
jgi:hypothetical protein